MKLFNKLFLTLIVLMAAMVSQATVYYVSTNGNNSWNGQAPAFVSGTTGPFLNFQNVNWAASHALAPGDVLYVRGGTYDHSGDGVGTCLRIFGVAATQGNPIIVSNYPGEYPVISGSGPNNNTIDLRGDAWIKIFGLNSTNAYRSVSFQGITNCEVAYCDIGGGNTNIGFLDECDVVNNSQCNWFHDDHIHHNLDTPLGELGIHNFVFGQFYSNSTPGIGWDATCSNIVENCVLNNAGHDTLAFYGQFNYAHGNLIHNEEWYFRGDIQQLGGHRCVEIGGGSSIGNVLDGNRCQNAGLNSNGGSHGLELDGVNNNIIRWNIFASNYYSGVIIYGQKVNTPTNTAAHTYFWGSNYIYGNTIAQNGFGLANVQTYTLVSGTWQPSAVVNNANWTWSAACANSTANFFVNNLFIANHIDGVLSIGSLGFGDIRGNLTNTLAASHIVDTTVGGALSATQPDYHLTLTSPARGVGVWNAVVTSSSGSGTVVQVDNSDWFWAGITAAGHTVPGDTIQIQSSGNTAVILSISGRNITLNRSVTWTSGTGIMPLQGGNLIGVNPDVGAFQFGGATTNWSLTTSLNPAQVAASVTFTYAVTTNGLAALATGTVTFLDNGVSIGTGTLSGGVATFATSSLSIGTHPITATYPGDGTYLASSSGTLNETITLIPTTLTLSASASLLLVGFPVTFTSHVQTGGVTDTTATGTVTFLDNGDIIGTGTVTGGTATLTSSSLVVGIHFITVVYTGDSGFGSSSGGPQVVTILPPPLPINYFAPFLLNQ